MTLPTLDDNGFRIRGAPTPTDAFGHVPASVEALIQALRRLPAFAEAAR